MRTSVDLVNEIIEYEQGDMPDDRVLAFFQELINSGLAWKLQGHYGRTAQQLIDAGYCYRKENENASDGG